MAEHIQDSFFQWAIPMVGMRNITLDSNTQERITKYLDYYRRMNKLPLDITTTYMKPAPRNCFNPTMNFKGILNLGNVKKPVNMTIQSVNEFRGIKESKDLCARVNVRMYKVDSNGKEILPCIETLNLAIQEGFKNDYIETWT